VTSDTAGVFGFPVNITQNQTFKFTSAGTFPSHCNIHPLHESDNHRHILNLALVGSSGSGEQGINTSLSKAVKGREICVDSRKQRADKQSVEKGLLVELMRVSVPVFHTLLQRGACMPS
jgi:hypothetical protein